MRYLATFTGSDSVVVAGSLVTAHFARHERFAAIGRRAVGIVWRAERTRIGLCKQETQVISRVIISLFFVTDKSLTYAFLT